MGNKDLGYKGSELKKTSIVILVDSPLVLVLSLYVKLITSEKMGNLTMELYNNPSNKTYCSNCISVGETF